MSWRTRDAITSLGLPVPDHRSRQATAHELDTADLVIALAREHVMWMRRVHRTASPRTATLKRLARDLPDDNEPLFERVARMRLHELHLEPWEDVLDPAGGDLDVFLDCAREAGLVASEHLQARFPPSELATVSLNYFTAG